MLGSAHVKTEDRSEGRRNDISKGTANIYFGWSVKYVKGRHLYEI